jgi:hypothetical protein
VVNIHSAAAVATAPRQVVVVHGLSRHNAVQVHNDRVNKDQMGSHMVAQVQLRLVQGPAEGAHVAHRDIVPLHQHGQRNGEL